MLAIGEACCQNWNENRYIGQSFSQSTASTTTFSENHWKRTVQKYYYNNTTALGVGTTHIPPYFCDNTQPNEQSAFAPKGAVLPLPLAEHMDWTRYECPGTLLHLVRVKLPRSERHQCQESFLEKKTQRTSSFLHASIVTQRWDFISPGAKDTGMLKDTKHEKSWSNKKSWSNNAKMKVNTWVNQTSRSLFFFQMSVKAWVCIGDIQDFLLQNHIPGTWKVNTESIIYSIRL